MREKYNPSTRHAGSFPDPTGVDCIITTKVYDACRQQECEFFEFGAFEVPFGWDFEDIFAYAEVVPSSVSFDVLNISLIEGGPLARVQMRVCADINAFIVNTRTGEEEQIIGDNGFEDNEVCFEKDVILYLPEPDKMDAIAEAIFQIAGEPVIEEFDDTEDEMFNIFIPIGAFIIVKSVAEVQLLVPVYGFCPTPPLCEEFPDVDACEEFQLLPFPDFYPPQPEDE
ncbi:hypothetical protein HYG86_06360 [Alkalicella caledoniensis]|uniref:Uncharacterized protein n=1 Tax=Alkalicella caledoniensis TaxID=2731377 RepID=A0A7G9W6V8_ALKCA|nr:hypothetical protein [Alkalicella caledoniensis]QNO14420.1 hypothetical protein HYG86_06360 [Alkalicella caledoniensis]